MEEEKQIGESRFPCQTTPGEKVTIPTHGPRQTDGAGWWNKLLGEG